MKCAIHPNYTKDGKAMVILGITILVDEQDEEVVNRFLKTTKAREILEISGLPAISGRNLAVDIKN